jgi:hypothetical protein
MIVPDLDLKNKTKNRMARMASWRNTSKIVQSYELACAHKKRSEISGETRFFGLVVRPVRRALQDAKDITGLDVHVGEV